VGSGAGLDAVAKREYLSPCRKPNYILHAYWLSY